MNDVDRDLRDQLNREVDTRLGPRLPAPPFDPYRAQRGIGRRNAWLWPLAAAAVVLAVAGTTVATTGVLADHKTAPVATLPTDNPTPPISAAPSTTPTSQLPTSPVASNSSTPAATSAPAGPGPFQTDVVVLRPVNAAGQVQPGWTVNPTPRSGSCLLVTSDAAVDAGVTSCLPTAMSLPACWPSGRTTEALCLQSPFTNALTQVAVSGRGMVQVPSASKRIPAAVRLPSGVRCLGAWNGTNPVLASDKSYFQVFTCDDGEALYTSGTANVFNRSGAVWTAQAASADGSGTLHPVNIASVVYYGTAL